MSLSETFLALEALNKTKRLLDLDDLWTYGLGLAVSDEDRPVVAEIGREMQALVLQLRDDLRIVRRVALRDRAAFERVAEEAIRNAPLTEAAKQAIRESYGELGWAAEAQIAFRYVEEYSEAEAAELASKVDQLLGGRAQHGDFRIWTRCNYRFVIFAVSAAGVLASGGALVPLALSLAGSALSLGDGLIDCRGDARRAPTEAEQIEILVNQRKRGDLTQEEFVVAKRRVLRLGPEISGDDGF